jgi:hypothetical protein
VKIFSSKQRVVIAMVAIVTILFLVRPGVSRLKLRIAGSISRAVARSVEIGSVHLRFLPPGFDLENLIVQEDPAFGAEPMLRAPEVMATVRLTSLLRGRLDVSRLELTEPSLNLVRRADGRWNWETLLEQAARTPTAPTAKSKSEVRPGFPYIEASSGRINLKSGQEKTPYALLDADFAVWQDSENAWGGRLQAHPIRTDVNLDDAGVLRVNGTWQRAPSLRETPLQFNIEWNAVQLGQLTKLFSGNDKGWRGTARLDATLKGPPAALQISVDTSIEDFHRYDISSGGGMRLKAHCDAKYSSAEQGAQEIFCTAPVGNGTITLHGDAGLPGVHRINLALELENIPANAAAQLALRSKQNLPPDLVAAGNVRGNFVVREESKSEQKAEFEGSGEISRLQLQSASGKVNFAAATVPFVLTTGQGRSPKIKSPTSGAFVPVVDGLRVEFGPFAVALGRPSPAQAQGWFGRSGYALAIHGEGEIAPVLQLASLLGVPAIKTNAQGVAQMELLVSGPWTSHVSDTSSGFSAPQVTGKVQLHNVRATLHGLNGAVEISSAELLLSPDEARIDRLNARAGNAHWSGSISLPRNCGIPGACVANFNLNTEQVTLNGLHDWLHSPHADRRWYQVLSATEPAPPSFFQDLRAAGRVSAGRMLIRDVVANRISASLQLEHGSLKLSDLRADVLGGKQRGDWEIDFSSGSPVYRGSGTLTAISLVQVADAMHDSWISGSANVNYQFKASGTDSPAFWKSAEGAFQFEMWDAVLSHIALNTDDPPLRVGGWLGRAHLQDEKFEIDKGKLISPSGAYDVSGTASFGQELDFKLTQESETKSGRAAPVVYDITGTLSDPRVNAIPQQQTQARLKP